MVTQNAIASTRLGNRVNYKNALSYLKPQTLNIPFPGGRTAHHPVSAAPKNLVLVPTV